MLIRLIAAAILSLVTTITPNAGTNESTAADTIKALDARYQKAVESGDGKTMAELLADDFILVNGRGIVSTKADLIKGETSGDIRYEIQSDTDQSVRIFEPAIAVITAKLHMKGTYKGKPFDYVLWFSDTYARRDNGWKYVFGQASMPLSQ